MFRTGGNNQCMFNGITTCGRDALNFTNVVCAKHAREIYEISQRKCKMIDTRMREKHMVHVTSENYSPEYNYIPFPISIKADNGNGGSSYSYSGFKLCIDQKSLVNCISAFIGNRNLTTKGYSPQQIQQVVQSVIAYITDLSYNPSTVLIDNSINFNYNNNITYNYNNFITFNRTRLMDYWKDYDYVAIVQDTGAIINWPIKKLPIFYQSMLIGFEVAEHTYAAVNGIAPPPRIMAPNSIINCITKMISSFNNTPDNVIYRDVAGTDVASPIVLCGRISHESQVAYNFFEKPEIYAGRFAGVARPGAC
ncbi:Vp39/31 k [Homarus gammarus nudivirus]|uniref:Vp39/31 k n=1 Tax=Homarus gammarus nudivirus TaxID=2509616 RepID=A0A411HB35_9VIRU|nr:Vp39/31 k [Homarus gammarus nudivirus]QBB28620.1 Vp39/31 k [Homarus gammarus nudivirus]